jgi:predicted membrane channel-forming protein YqfA (hemolysin III family)
METGWDPKATRMFKKIMNSVSFTLLWMLAMATTGFYFKLAVVEETVTVKNIIFFSLFIISLLLLIRYLYNTWKNDF